MIGKKIKLGRLMNVGTFIDNQVGITYCSKLAKKS